MAKKTTDEPKDNETFGTGHRDPFLGLCIHGVPGARIVNGELKSYDCSNCFPEYDDPDQAA